MCSLLWHQVEKSNAVYTRYCTLPQAGDRWTLFLPGWSWTQPASGSPVASRVQHIAGQAFSPLPWQIVFDNQWDPVFRLTITAVTNSEWFKSFCIHMKDLSAPIKNMLEIQTQNNLKNYNWLNNLPLLSCHPIPPIHFNGISALV